MIVTVTKFDFYRCDKLVKYWNMAKIRSHAHNALSKSRLNETWCISITLGKSDAEIKAEPCLNCCLASPCLKVKYYPAQTVTCHPGTFRCLCVFCGSWLPVPGAGLQRPWGGRLQELRTRLITLPGWPLGCGLIGRLVVVGWNTCERLHLVFSRSAGASLFVAFLKCSINL